MEPLPQARELALAPGEEPPAITRAHGAVLAALLDQNLALAQRLTADLIDLFDGTGARPPGPKSLRLIEFVVLLS